MATSILNKFTARFSNHIGIDLGTANTLVYLAPQGIVINEPSVVAINEKTGNVIAVGKAAKDMIGKTPGHIKTVRPILDGVVSDFEITEEMLGYLIKKANDMSRKMFAPRVVIGVPSEVTSVEIKAVYDAARSAGAKEVYLVEEPMAAAIGMGLPIQDATGSMVIDIGGGTTDVAVIALFGVVKSKSLRVAGDRLNQDIIEYIRNRYEMIIGEKTAEEIKIQIGTVRPTGKEFMRVVGRDLVTGLPKEVQVLDNDIARAMQVSLSIIIQAVKEVIEKTPPEILTDIMNKGIHLTGGGAYIKGLTELMKEEFGIAVTVPEDPLAVVAKGCGKILENIEMYKEALIDTDEVNSK
jgi:rod shape-determining protein MreB and related proteins